MSLKSVSPSTLGLPSHGPVILRSHACCPHPCPDSSGLPAGTSQKKPSWHAWAEPETLSMGHLPSARPRLPLDLQTDHHLQISAPFLLSPPQETGQRPVTPRGQHGCSLTAALNPREPHHQCTPDPGRGLLLVPTLQKEDIPKTEEEAEEKASEEGAPFSDPWLGAGGVAPPLGTDPCGGTNGACPHPQQPNLNLHRGLTSIPPKSSFTQGFRCDLIRKWGLWG